MIDKPPLIQQTIGAVAPAAVPPRPSLAPPPLEPRRRLLDQEEACRHRAIQGSPRRPPRPSPSLPGRLLSGARLGRPVPAEWCVCVGSQHRYPQANICAQWGSCLRWLSVCLPARLGNSVASPFWEFLRYRISPLSAPGQAPPLERGAVHLRGRRTPSSRRPFQSGTGRATWLPLPC